MASTTPYRPELGRAYRRLTAAFAATLIGLLGLTIQSVRHLKGLADSSAVVSEEDAPAIAQLATIRGSALYARSSTREALNASPDRRAALLDTVHTRVAEIDRLIAEHLKLHSATRGAPQEESAYRSFEDALVDVTAKLAAGNQVGAAQVFDTTRETMRNFDHALETDILEHSADAHRHSGGVRTALSSFISESLGLTVLGMVGALVLLLLAVNSVRLAIASLEARQKATEERATELDAFAGSVAHDLRGQLTVIRVVLGSAARHAADEKTKNALDRSNASIDVLNRMIEEMLEFARSGAKPQAAQCDTAEVLLSVAQELQPRAEADRIALKVMLSHATAAIGDLPLRMIAFNLVDNAIKYMGEGTNRSVEIVSRPDSGRTVLEVRDTGIGIPDDAMPRLFDPYFRGREVGRENGATGYGLGLATVKRLVEAHGGNITVNSSVGKGTTVRVSLPPVAG